jgi:hypothetical protein
MRLLPNSSRRGLFCVMGACALFTALCGSATAQVAASTPGGAGTASAPAMSNPAPTPGPSPGKTSTSAAAASPSESPAPSGSAATASGSPTDGGYTVRLRSLEKNVNELKEQIFRTKARLNLLKETVLGGTLGASRAVIHHKNEMGSSYRLIKAVYALDGVQIFSKADESGRLAEMAEFDIYNGAIQPGSHTLTVMMIYQGNGFGVFSYLKGYKMTVRSSHTFVAGEAKATAITVVGYEKGNITTNLQDRPAVDFRVNVMAVEPAGTASSTSSTGSSKN